MTTSPESEWREWYRANYGVRAGPTPHARGSEAAWLAAAQRRDSLTAAERELVEAALLDRGWPVSDYHGIKPTYARFLRALEALRAARQPKPVDHLQVDHLQEALDRMNSIPWGSHHKVAEEVIDHLTAAIARSKEQS